MYKYETHLHTCEASACATASGREQALLHKEAGYDGIIITDHFFRGNTCISRKLPWEERINLFFKGYENAKKIGDEIGLKVFFGYEETFQGTDFLVYGLSKEWMLSHPEMEFFTIDEQHKAALEQGGMVIHAHPFRDRPYIPQIRLFPKSVDGVEVVNYGNHESENHNAFRYAKEYNLPITGGSDGHTTRIHGGGIKCTKELNSIQDYIALIKSREEIILL